MFFIGSFELLVELAPFRIMHVKLQKILSFVWPQTRFVDSDHSGQLEITYLNGKKVLDSQNANYSYGSLQKVLNKGLAAVDLNRINSVLILGLGGGSVVSSLRHKFQYHGSIQAVELDHKIINLAIEEFGHQASDKLEIVQADAFDFMVDCTHKFDLIVVDLFIDNEVPAPFYENEFCKNTLRCLNEQGSLIFNLGINSAQNVGRQNAVDFYSNETGLSMEMLENVGGTNRLIVGTMNAGPSAPLT
jgi:spermidine synthase